MDMLDRALRDDMVRRLVRFGEGLKCAQTAFSDGVQAEGLSALRFCEAACRQHLFCRAVVSDTQY